LIKVISKPTLNINGLNAASNSRITTSLFEVIGLLSFTNSSESEILKSYQIFLKDASKKIILHQSDIIYSNNLNNPN
jgi:hypothetical protein